MISFKSFINESSNHIIVIDVQQAFARNIYFDLEDFGEYLKKAIDNHKKINYFTQMKK